MNALGVTKGQLSEWTTCLAQNLGIPGAFTKWMDYDSVWLALYIDPQSVPTHKRINFRTVLNALSVSKVQFSEWTTFMSQTCKKKKGQKDRNGTLGIPWVLKKCRGFDSVWLALYNGPQFWMPQVSKSGDSLSLQKCTVFDSVWLALYIGPQFWMPQVSPKVS